ncbi:MAG: RNA polymerase sigma factor [Acidimicrobiales bacterium]
MSERSELPESTVSSPNGHADVEALYRRDAEMLRRYARKSGADETEAEDLTQETFARALARPPSQTSPESATPGRAWLHTVAANLMRDGWRREKRADTRSDHLMASERLRKVSQPDEVAVTQWEGDLLRQALMEVPPETRQVLVLRIIEGRSADEVAQIIGRTPDAVRQIQFRGLKRLRNDLLAKGWERDSSPALNHTEKGGPRS